MRHFVYRILSLRTRRTNERTMSKSNNNKDDDDDKNNASRVKKPLFSSLLFNIGQRDFDEKDDASSSSSRLYDHGGELARIIRARSTRFLRHASPTVAAVEENVKASIALARGDALTKTLEVHALMDADGKHAGQSLARVNEDYNANGAFFSGVEKEASSLAKTKRDVEALVEAKEKEREKEEEKRDKETKERRRKELKEAMMFRKEEEEEEEEE